MDLDINSCFVIKAIVKSLLKLVTDIYFGGGQTEVRGPSVNSPKSKFKMVVSLIGPNIILEFHHSSPVGTKSSFGGVSFLPHLTSLFIWIWKGALQKNKGAFFFLVERLFTNPFVFLNVNKKLF